MYGFVRVAAAVPRSVPADVKANAKEICSLIKKAEKAGASLAVFPELALSAYTCGDLFLHSALVEACEKALEKIAASTEKCVAVVGLPVREKGMLYNVAVVCSEGKAIGAVPKIRLQNEEARFFASGEKLEEITLGGKKIPCGAKLVFASKTEKSFTFGVTLGDDMRENASALCSRGAKIICNPASSAEVFGSAETRRAIVGGQSAVLGVGFVYAGCGSGESTTDRVYAGHRLIAECGDITAESELLTDGLTVSEIDLDRTESRIATEPCEHISFGCADFDGALTRTFSPTPFLPKEGDEGAAELILSLQAQGLKRRLESAKTVKTVVGISGGLDSALALLVAVRASKDSSDVTAVTMPCFGTGKKTLANARALCEGLGVTFREIPLADSVRKHFADIAHDESVKNAAYENAQARERTQVLLDIANESGAIVVGTGDLSELALGWCTYGGDQMSSYGVNGSVPKTLVKYLVRYSAGKIGGQAGKALASVASTEVSPELLPPEGGEISQKTEDILGKYLYHDFILYYAVGRRYSPKKVMYLALNVFGEDKKAEIKKAMTVFYTRFFTQQFKRSCMPDGVQVTPLSLSPRGGLSMPSDACAALWLKETEEL